MDITLKPCAFRDVITYKINNTDYPTLYCRRILEEVDKGKCFNCKDIDIKNAPYIRDEDDDEESD